MEAPHLARAVDAGRSVAFGLGLPVDRTEIVHNSNRIAVRLSPCNVLARVGPPPFRSGLEAEIAVALALAGTGCPVAQLDPRVEARVYDHDDFAVTLWTFHEPVPPPELEPDEYVDVLRRMHAAMATISPPSPHFTDRVADALRDVGVRELSPELGEADRDLLRWTLEEFTSRICGRRPAEQLLHGEPHPGNLLRTRHGLLLVDLETYCRGPIEFDVAHVPVDVGDVYPGLDPDLLRDCRILMQAMITAWRWRDDDEFPDRRYWRRENLRRLRAALDATEDDDA